MRRVWVCLGYKLSSSIDRPIINLNIEEMEERDKEDSRASTILVYIYPSIRQSITHISIYPSIRQSVNPSIRHPSPIYPIYHLSVYGAGAAYLSYPPIQYQGSHLSIPGQPLGNTRAAVGALPKSANSALPPSPPASN